MPVIAKKSKLCTIYSFEKVIAKRLNRSVEKTFQTLEKMHRANVISYFAQNDSPRVYFAEERLSDNNFSINKKRYSFRKKRALKKSSAMIAYVKSDSCRSAELVSYFGEKDAGSCGICDICLKKK